MYIQISLEAYFQSKILLNPFMDDKALLKGNDDFLDLEFDGNQRQVGNFHLKIEIWSQEEHSRLKLIEGFGGWILLDPWGNIRIINIIISRDILVNSQ